MRRRQVDLGSSEEGEDEDVLVVEGTSTQKAARLRAKAAQNEAQKEKEAVRAELTRQAQIANQQLEEERLLQLDKQRQKLWLWFAVSFACFYLCAMVSSVPWFTYFQDFCIPAKRLHLQGHVAKVWTVWRCDQGSKNGNRAISKPKR